MPHRPLPANPSFVHLRNQARDLLRLFGEGDPAGLQRIREFHPRSKGLDDAQIRSMPFRLSDAQLTIAREYSFASWPALKEALEVGSMPDPATPLEDHIVDAHFREAVRRIDAGDAVGLRGLLAGHPHLVRQHVYFSASDYFGRPGLLQFIAQNPIRQRRMPNVVEVARVILDAGPGQADMNDALGLVSTGCVPRECGVQIELIDLLCARGARPGSLLGVLAHGEFAAAEALLRNGAELRLPAAAALNLKPEFDRLLPTAIPQERHEALALSAQWGQLEPLRALTAQGEDLNRYNPPGAHAHSTPLHQAVVHGQREAVQMLLDAGARKDIPDTLWSGTARGWALHEGREEMLELLGD